MTETYSTNELKHWGLSKGQQAPNHKYIARIETGDAKSPYRYFYTQAEYDMYLANKQREQGAIDAGKKVSEGISSMANKFNNLVNKVAATDPHSGPHGDQFLQSQQAMQNIGSDYNTLKNKNSEYLDAITARKERAAYNQKFEEVFGDNGGKDYKNMNQRVQNRSEALERQHSLSSEPNKVYNEKAGAYVDNSVNSMKISEADYQKERRRMDALEKAADDYDKANRITTSVKRVYKVHKKYKNMKHSDLEFDSLISSDEAVGSDYLEHYGRKGMKWYQRIFSGAKSMAKGGAKLGMHKVSDKVQDKTTTRGHQESDSVTKDHATAMKNAAMRSGDPRMIAKYSHLMDNKEFQAAVSRMGDQQRLNQALASQNKTIFDKIGDWEKRTDNITKLVDHGIKGYEQYGKLKGIYNKDFKGKKSPKAEAPDTSQERKSNPNGSKDDSKPWSGTVEGAGNSKYDGHKQSSYSDANYRQTKWDDRAFDREMKNVYDFADRLDKARKRRNQKSLPYNQLALPYKG